ncbi:MAG: ASKHA domain-containing protein, partial [Caldilineaceae bacterium]
YAAKRNFAPGMRLSCACQVTGDVVIRVPEESQLRKQVVRKAAGVARAVDVDAAMRLYYVELPAAELKDHRGDWERLQDELAAVHGLDNLRVDWSVLTVLQETLAKGNRALTATVWNEREVVHVQPGFHDAIYGIAVDVGTTTVAGNLCHLRTGEILASASRMNPQVPFGEDLMSRVSYAMMNADGTERMHGAIIAGLNELVDEMCAQAGIAPADVIEMVLVGNTTMHHLLLGVNPRELGGAPFSLVIHSAVDVKARGSGPGHRTGRQHPHPALRSGSRGCGQRGRAGGGGPYAKDEQALIIDIGTNGEILLGNREQVLSASSPTGPAFEGADRPRHAADGAIERVRIDPATLEVRLVDRRGQHGCPPSRSRRPPPDAGSPPRPQSGQGRALLNPTLRPSGICGRASSRRLRNCSWPWCSLPTAVL